MADKHQKSGKILKVEISSTSIPGVLDFALSSLKKKRKFFITTPNPEILVKANSNKALRKALGFSDIALPDGIGIILAAKFLGLSGLKLIRGREMMLEFFNLANKKRLKVFLLGTKPQVINLSLSKIKKEYPNIKIYGLSGPKLDNKANPVSEVDVKLQIDALDKINRIQPDLLFVAFGAPKQEIWVYKHIKSLRVGGVMVVGGSLDYFAGVAKLPPRWLAKIGFEWLWRLFHQPRRIIRIIKATVIFPLMIMREKLTGR